MGRLTNILHQTTSGGVLVAQYGYTLDAIGKTTLLTTTLLGNVTRLEQYRYDYFDRLTNVVYADNGVISANSLNVSYTYDGNGNRLTMTTKTNNAVTEVRSYSYGNENRLLTVTNQSGAAQCQLRLRPRRKPAAKSRHEQHGVLYLRRAQPDDQLWGQDQPDCLHLQWRCPAREPDNERRGDNLHY